MPVGSALKFPSSLDTPYFATSCSFQKTYKASPILHNHLPNEAWLINFKGLKPRPPSCLGLHTDAQSTKWNFLLVLFSHHKKSCWSFFHMLYYGGWALENWQAINRKIWKSRLHEDPSSWGQIISFPRKLLFHPFHHWVHTNLLTWPRHRGSPKYVAGKEQTLHPQYFCQPEHLRVTLIPISSLLKKFIC